MSVMDDDKSPQRGGLDQDRELLIPVSGDGSTPDDGGRDGDKIVSSAALSSFDHEMTSSLAWYPLPQSGGTVSAGDEFFENQTADWSLWSFSTSNDQNTTEEKREDGHAQCCSTGPSEEEQTDEDPAPFEEPLFTQPADDFLSQFSDEEMRMMDAAFEPLDMFPDSMDGILSYEDMLTGVLTGSEEGDAKLDGNPLVDTMDTCGFPLFSHDLQNDSRNADPASEEDKVPLFSHDLQNDSRNADPPSEEDKVPLFSHDLQNDLRNADPASEEDKAGLSMTKRSRPITDTESTPGVEASVLEELEDVVFQLTRRTRICYRDAFYRLAESSKASCSAANGAAEVGSSTRRQSFQQPGADASRFSTPCCPGRVTNPVDRAVMALTTEPTRQLHGNGCGDDSGAEARPTSSWTARA